MQGFDAKGSEAYWTVTGDEVTTMAFANFTNSPGKELLVGSKDNEIRIFQNEQAIEEILEIDEVTRLCPIYSSKVRDLSIVSGVFHSFFFLRAHVPRLTFPETFFLLFKVWLRPVERHHRDLQRLQEAVEGEEQAPAHLYQQL